MGSSQPLDPLLRSFFSLLLDAWSNIQQRVRILSLSLCFALARGERRGCMITAFFRDLQTPPPTSPFALHLKKMACCIVGLCVCVCVLPTEGIHAYFAARLFPASFSRPRRRRAPTISKKGFFWSSRLFKIFFAPSPPIFQGIFATLPKSLASSRDAIFLEAKSLGGSLLVVVVFANGHLSEN